MLLIPQVFLHLMKPNLLVCMVGIISLKVLLFPITHTSVSKRVAGIKSNEVKRISNAPTPFEELPMSLAPA